MKKKSLKLVMLILTVGLLNYVNFTTAQTNSNYFNQAISLAEFKDHLNALDLNFTSEAFAFKTILKTVKITGYDTVKIDDTSKNEKKMVIKRVLKDSIINDSTTIFRNFNDPKFMKIYQIIFKESNKFNSDSGQKTQPAPGELPGPNGGKAAFFSVSLPKVLAHFEKMYGNEANQNILANLLILSFGSRAEIKHAKDLELPTKADMDLYNANLKSRSVVQNIVPQAFSQEIGGGYSFNESAIIYGVVDWIIAKAKVELLESVFDKLYNNLNKDTIAKTLLANTLKTYSQFEASKSVNLAKYGDLWKASFEKDFKDLPIHLSDEQFVDLILERAAPGWAYRDELTPLVAGSMSFVYGITQKKHPINILSEISTKYYTEAPSEFVYEPYFKRAVLLADVITEALGSFNENVYSIVGLGQLKNMTLAQWQTFLKLIYVKNGRKLTLCFGTDPITLLDEIQNGPGARFYNLLVQFASTYQAIEEILASHGLDASNTDKTLTSGQISKLIDLSVSVISNTLPYINVKIDPRYQQVADLITTEIGPVTLSIQQIGQGVATKEYGQVLNGGLQFLNHANKVYSVLAGESPRMDVTINDLTRYGSFMVNILSAQNADAVQSALDELVPTNQYKLKNISRASISISAYPGIIVARETLHTGVPEAPASTFQPKGTTLGLYLPIGVDFNLGLGTSSFTLFLQALDLGAVMNYRLNSDTTTTTNPTISFQQLLSPGVSFMWRITNWPIVIGVNYSYTPELRKVDQGGIVTYANSSRFGFFVAVDVTALHITISKGKFSNN